ncbi:MAG: hypothetical protein JRF40_04110 [Deltaproteobacteria bacterium]|nr:hypothetical protein [Deltaproteobacteria bacterium]
MFSVRCIMFSAMMLLSVAGYVNAETDNCKVLDEDIADTYEGGCEDGLAHGKGRASGRDSYDWEFKNGRQHGECTYTWFSGDVFSGSWTEGKRNGWGTLNRPDGAYYEGEWKDGMRHGNGMYKWSNSAHYEGEWKEDERWGMGVFYGSDGSYYKGEWEKGMQHGKGMYKWPSGTYFNGEWKNGKQVNEAEVTMPITLDQHVYDVLEAEREKTGESASEVVKRAILLLKKNGGKKLKQKKK